MVKSNKPSGDIERIHLTFMEAQEFLGVRHQTLYKLMKEGYVDATGVQDLFFEADAIMDALLEAIEKGQTKPEKWIQDPGFALTQENMAEREMDMWGCKILQDSETGTP